MSQRTQRRRPVKRANPTSPMSQRSVSTKRIVKNNNEEEIDISDEIKQEDNR